MKHRPLISYSLLALLGVALAVRLWGINHQIYTDENKVITPSVRLAQGKQEPLLYPKGSYYPHFYHYVLGAAFIPAALLGAPYPSPDTSVDVYTRIARIVTALFGTATIYVVYRIGKELRNPTLGLIAALFLAFLPLHVKYSHYAHVDIPLTLATTLAVWAAIRLAQTGRLKWYILTGIFTGLSGATHYTGLTVGIVLILAHIAIIAQHKAFLLREIFSRKILLGLLVIPLAFIAATPYTVIKLKESTEIYKQLQLRGAGGDLGYTRPDFFWPLTTASPDWGLPFTVSGVWWEFSPFIVALAILGVCIALYKKDWLFITIIGAAIIIMYIAIIGRLPLYAIKRLLPLTPLVSILAAWAVFHISKWKKPNNLIVHYLLVAGVSFVTLQNIILAIGFDMAYAGGSTHSNAVAFAKEHIPHGSTILQHTPIKLIDWNDTNYNTVRIDEVYANLNASDPEVSHDRAKDISYWVKEKNVQYIAMDSRIVDRYFDPTSSRLYPEATASYRAFYEEIRSRGHLVYRIDPKLWHIAGPRVEIYDVSHIE